MTDQDELGVRLLPPPVIGNVKKFLPGVTAGTANCSCR
jgi:hypothetical protein